MLRVDSARVRYGDTVALGDVSIEITTGETLALLGPSGSGKTTLLRAIAGLQTLDDGTISWDGADVTNLPPHHRRFGLVFQDFALFPHLDVGANVAFGLRMAGIPADDRRRRVTEALERVDLAGYESRSVHSLSGGQAQRVALARALVVEPRMLLLDEPFGALDRELRQRLALDLRDLLDRLGITALHVTHDQDEAFAVADRVAVLVAGSLLQVDRPESLWRRPASEEVARFLGLQTILDGRVEDGVASTALGDITLPGTPDGPVRLVVRPEAVELGEGTVEGTVTSVLFRGTDSWVVLDVDGMTLEAVSARPPRRGARVGVSVAADGVSVLPT